MNRNLAFDLAQQLWEAEAANAAALAAASKLLESVVQAERASDLSAMVGAEPLRRLGLAVSGMSSARAELCAAHSALATRGKRLGVWSLDAGPLSPEFGGGAKFTRTHEALSGAQDEPSISV